MRRLAPILLLALPAAALACGVCVEDKVAVTYDHAVVARAIEERHAVVFVEVKGSSTPAALAHAAAHAAAGVPGIDRASIRAAADPAALAFAVNPDRTTPERAIAAVERTSTIPVQLTLLRVVQ